MFYTFFATSNYISLTEFLFCLLKNVFDNFYFDWIVILSEFYYILSEFILLLRILISWILFCRHKTVLWQKKKIWPKYIFN
jgi:hypothetical protein